MTEADVRTAPFPHASGTRALGDREAGDVLRWMRGGAPWRLRVASFYEQWELPVDADMLPADLAYLCEGDFVRGLVSRFLLPIAERPLDLVEVTAHKLVAGQTIRIHNDFIEGQESHRLLLQFNGGWRDEQGGLLLLFGSDSSRDVRRIIRPIHGSGFGFEISPRSFHAVSTIHEGERFTLVYSFRTRDVRI